MKKKAPLDNYIVPGKWVDGIPCFVAPRSGPVDFAAVGRMVRRTVGHMMSNAAIHGAGIGELTQTYLNGDVVVRAFQRSGKPFAEVYVRPKGTSGGGSERKYPQTYMPYNGVVFRGIHNTLEVYDPDDANPEWKIITASDMIQRMFGDPPPEVPPTFYTTPLLTGYSPSAKSANKFDKNYNAIVAENVQLNAAMGNILNPTEEKLHPYHQKIRRNSAILSVTPRKTDLSVKSVPFLQVPVPKNLGQWENQVVTQTITPASMETYDVKRYFKPTMFTGRMRMVVQWCLGYGQRTKKMDTYAQRPDGSTFDYAAYDYRTKKQADGEDKWYAGAPSFEPFFHQTDGLYTTSNGRQYLIRINAAGIWAMRLPVLRKSKDKLPVDMQEYIYDIPLGIGFPRTALTNAEVAANAANPDPTTHIKTPWAKAIAQGWVFKIDCDVSEFYTLQSTYTECGWAFSYSGKKADNVGWRWNDSPPPYDYKILEHWSIDIGGGDGPGIDKYDYAHNAKGYDNSINTLTATIRRVDKGPAASVRIKTPGSFKVPIENGVDWNDLGRMGVVSFDYTPAGLTRFPANAPYDEGIKNFPVTDCPIHVFYDGEELVWARLYYDPKGVKSTTDSYSSVEDMRQQYPTSAEHILLCNGGHSWGFTTNHEAPEVSGFYTSREDPRKAPEQSYGSYNSVGFKRMDSGRYVQLPYTFPYLPLYMGALSSRHDPDWFESEIPPYGRGPWCAKWHSYNVTVKGTAIYGRSYGYALAIPDTDREAVFICESESGGSRSVTDYGYTVNFMDVMYYIYPNNIPNMEDALGGGSFGIPQQSGLEEWEYRDDTVKYVVARVFPLNTCASDLCGPEYPAEPVSKQLQLRSGCKFPVHHYDNSYSTSNPPKYTVYVTQSETFAPYSSKLDISSAEYWFKWLPEEVQDGITSAPFWATRSVIGMPSEKLTKGVYEACAYAGLNAKDIDSGSKGSNYIQATFIGET